MLDVPPLFPVDIPYEDGNVVEPIVVMDMPEGSFDAAVERILDELRNGCDEVEAPAMAPTQKALTVGIGPLHQTLLAYVAERHPGQLEWLTTTPEEAYADDELWMSFKEAEMGLEPRFGPDGERIWHPFLLGWAVLRMRSGGE